MFSGKSSPNLCLLRAVLILQALGHDPSQPEYFIPQLSADSPVCILMACDHTLCPDLTSRLGVLALAIGY